LGVTSKLYYDRDCRSDDRARCTILLPERLCRIRLRLVPPPIRPSGILVHFAVEAAHRKAGSSHGTVSAAAIWRAYTPAVDVGDGGEKPARISVRFIKPKAVCGSRRPSSLARRDIPIAISSSPLIRPIRMRRAAASAVILDPG
jgi:hypothetical protein